MEKRNPALISQGFLFVSVPFFFNIHQGIIMGQLNSDSSLCKWHLNAGKQLTNKEAAARLVLTGPLRLVSMLWVFWVLISCQMTRSITMNTKMLLCFAEGGDRLCASCWGPEVFPEQWSGTTSGTTHIPRQDSPLPLKAACGFNLITPLLTKLSVLSGS